jgi:hypothetical protein
MPEITDTTELSPDQPDTELNLDHLEAISGGDKPMTTTLSNVANMRHEMLKTVANNLRA